MGKGLPSAGLELSPLSEERITQRTEMSRVAVGRVVTDATTFCMPVGWGGARP